MSFVFIFTRDLINNHLDHAVLRTSIWEIVLIDKWCLKTQSIVLLWMSLFPRWSVLNRKREKREGWDRQTRMHFFRFFAPDCGCAVTICLSPTLTSLKSESMAWNHKSNKNFSPKLLSISTFIAATGEKKIRTVSEKKKNSQKVSNW